MIRAGIMYRPLSVRVRDHHQIASFTVDLGSLGEPLMIGCACMVQHNAWNTIMVVVQLVGFWEIEPWMSLLKGPC